MAVVYETIASDGPTAGSRTVTKPTGLAVGDLMIGIANCENELDVPALPSGFTTLETQEAGAGAGNGGVVIVGYKIADSGDVAASNFSFTNGGSVMAASLVRVSGGSTDIQSNSDGESGGTSTPTLTMGVTPSQASSLLLFILHASDNSNAARTASTYAVTTSNPSWTEILDINTTSGDDLLLAVAHATRTETTDTGDATVTLSGSSSGIAGVLLSIAPLVNVSVSPAVQSIVSSILAPTVTGDANITSSVQSLVSSVVSPIVSVTEPDWGNQSKSSSSWTNDTKN